MHEDPTYRVYLAKGFDVIRRRRRTPNSSTGERAPAAPVREGRLAIHETAVGDAEGFVDFYVSDEDLWASMTPDM